MDDEGLAMEGHSVRHMGASPAFGSLVCRDDGMSKTFESPLGPCQLVILHAPCSQRCKVHSAAVFRRFDVYSYRQSWGTIGQQSSAVKSMGCGLQV